jgi:hypothetical protein
VNTYPATSLGTYFSAVNKIRTLWTASERPELWFRAEDAKHRKTRLQPGLYRPKHERRKPIPTLLRLENKLYVDFGRCAPQLSDVKSCAEDLDWDTYLLMQHHGVPTRLLDWSDGALIALHFAVRDKAVPPTSGSVVYVLDAGWLTDKLRNHPNRADLTARWEAFSKTVPDQDGDDWARLYLPCDEDDEKNPLLSTPDIPMLDDAIHITRRVAAQRSRFMIFGSDPLWVSRSAQEKGARFAAIILPQKAIAAIRIELSDAGITESVVYPDLDGLGRELKQVWETSR